MAYEYNRHQEKWLTDLETTDVPQAKGRLKSNTGEFCCLGRYYESQEISCEKSESGDFLYLGHISALDDLAVQDLRLKSKYGDILTGKVDPVWRIKIGDHTRLTEMNDFLKWSFKEIAEFIRANPDAVFNDE